MTRFGCFVATATLLASSSALADRPRPTYIVTDPMPADPAELSGARGGQPVNLIYLNRCAAPGDCDFTASAPIEDSRTNQSSILQQNGSLTPFDAGDTAWAAIVDLRGEGLRAVQRRDHRPGPGTRRIRGGGRRHAGRARLLPKWRRGAVQLGIIDNAITYSFANLYRVDPDICGRWRRRPRTPSGSTTSSVRRPHDASRLRIERSGSATRTRRGGEFEERECMAAGSTQNSFASSADLRPRHQRAADVSDHRRRRTAPVNKGFQVSATASDDTRSPGRDVGQQQADPVGRDPALQLHGSATSPTACSRSRCAPSTYTTGHHSPD